MKPLVLRGDARRLPLPDESVDLLITSPPYFALRDYRDGDASLAGQIGSEPTPAEYIAALVDCTREWARVLKPSGSMFVNLGDKYYAGRTGGHAGGKSRLGERAHGGETVKLMNGFIHPDWSPKTLMLLPERYRIACVDELGLIARAVLVWSKPNGLPESVTDRVRRSHEDWVHLVKQPRYFAAVDEIREGYAPGTAARYALGYRQNGRTAAGQQATPSIPVGVNDLSTNPLGKLPGSVWTVATEPLQVPAGIDTDHFAAYPTEWPRRLILGWSPFGICTACGEGRRPVVDRELVATRGNAIRSARDLAAGPQSAGTNWQSSGGVYGRYDTTITGYACSCTPYTDHPGTGETANRRDYDPSGRGNHQQGDYGRKQAGEYARVGPWREYHFDRWTPAPTRPAVVVDPFGGTGTTAHVAAALGRIGVTVDLSSGYSSKLAASPELYDRRRRKVLGLDPPVVQVIPEGQLGFDWEDAS